MTSESGGEEKSGIDSTVKSVTVWKSLFGMGTESMFIRVRR